MFLSQLAICYSDMKWLLLILSTLLFYTSSAQQTEIAQLKANLQIRTLSQDSVARIYRQLMRIYYKKQQYGLALKMADAELKIWNTYSHHDSTTQLLLGETHFNIASAQKYFGAYAIALEHANKASEIYTNLFGENHPESLTVYTSLAQILCLNEKYNSALELTQITIKKYSCHRKRYPKTELNLAIMLASIFIIKSDYNKAYKALLSAKDLYHQFQDSVSLIFLARIYNELASLKDLQQARLEALTYFQKARLIKEKLYGKDSHHLIKTYLNIGLCYHRLENFSIALKYYKKSLLLTKKKHDLKHTLAAKIYHHISSIFHSINNLDSMHHYIQKSINIYKKTLGLNSLESIAPLRSLFYYYRRRQLFSLAQKYLHQCIFIQKKYFGAYHSDLSRMYYDMAYLHLDKNNYKQTIYYTEKAYQANHKQSKIIDHSLMLQIIEIQLNASIFLPYDEKIKTFALLDQLKQIIPKALSNLNFTTDKQQFIQKFREVCEKGILLSHQLYQSKPKKIYLAKILELMEYNKAVLLSQQIKENKQSTLDSITKSRDQLLSKIQLLEHQWKVAEKNNSKETTLIQRELFNHQKLYEKYNNSQYQFLAKYTPITLNSIQQKLTSNQLMINYFYATDHCYVLCIGQTKVELKSIPLENLQELKLFSSQLIDLNTSKENLHQSCIQFDAIAHQLFLKIFPFPLKEELIIIPDGLLNYTPFEALTTTLTPQNQATGFHLLNYALHQYTISYAYSATSYYFQQFKHTNRKNLQILGFAPSYHKHQYLPSLKANIEEVQYLQEQFDGHYYYNQNATKDKFLNALETQRIIHLATHGYADNNEFQQAKLFFTQKNTDSLSAILQPHEIIHAPFKVDFVALSSCQTGIGHWQQGEGIMSLARDFMYAGVPSILTTLWQINDKSSSLIIKNFYHYIKTHPKHEALKAAKQNYLQNASAFNAHPYFWAGYILLGNTNRLDINTTSSTNLWYIVSLSLSLSVIILFFVIKLYRNKTSASNH